MAVAKAVSRGGGSSRQDKLKDNSATRSGDAAASSPLVQNAYARILGQITSAPARAREASGSSGSGGGGGGWGGTSPTATPSNRRQSSAGGGGGGWGLASNDTWQRIQERRASTRPSAPEQPKNYGEVWDNFLRGYAQEHGSLASYGRPHGDAAARYEAITTRLDELGLETPDHLQQQLQYAGSTAAYGRIIDDLGIEPYDIPSREEAKLAEGPSRLRNEPKSQYQDITREHWDGLSDAQQKAVLLNTWLREAETADAELDADGIDKEFRNRYNYAFTGDIKEDAGAAYRPNTLAFLNTFGLRGENDFAAAQSRDLGITAAEIEQLRDFEIQLDVAGPQVGPQRLVTNFERRALQGLDGYESGTPLSLQPGALVELDRVLDEEFTRRSSFLGSGARRQTAADALDPLLGFGLRPDGSADFRAMLFDAIAGVGEPVDEGAITTLLAEQGISPADFYNFAGQRISAVQASGGELPLGFSEGVWRDAEELKRLLNLREA